MNFKDTNKAMLTKKKKKKKRNWQLNQAAPEFSILGSIKLHMKLITNTIEKSTTKCTEINTDF